MDARGVTGGNRLAKILQAFDVADEDGGERGEEEKRQEEKRGGARGDPMLHAMLRCP